MQRDVLFWVGIKELAKDVRGFRLAFFLSGPTKDEKDRTFSRIYIHRSKKAQIKRAFAQSADWSFEAKQKDFMISEAKGANLSLCTE